MEQRHKNALQAAALVREQLARRQTQTCSLALPEYLWEDLLAVSGKIGKAQARQWHAAAHNLSEEFLSRVDYFQARMADFLIVLRRGLHARGLPTVSEIYRDILSLEREFDQVDVDLDNHELSVQTEEIVLEGVNLGPFKIRLNWSELGKEPPYEVIALAPNPAASNEEVTHPHVQGGCLCEGDGRMPIRAALAEGRLLDLFMIPSQILSTYGQGRAYIELSNWTGEPCEGCGRNLDQDDRYRCERCDAILCDECGYTCPKCEGNFCCHCTVTCTTCNHEHCRSCLGRCPSCGKRTCSDCLHNGLCEECHEKRERQHANEQSENNQHEGTPVDRPSGPCPAPQPVASL